MKSETKTIKHKFTHDEREQLGGQLAQALGSLRGIESEFEQVKASYKFKTAEAEATIDRISTNITNGFEYRQAQCFVVFRVKDKEKDYFLEDGPVDSGPVLTERMTPEDFQTELELQKGKE